MEFNNNANNNYNNQQQSKMSSNLNNVLNRAINRPQLTSPLVSSTNLGASRNVLGLPSGLCASASNLSVASHIINQNFNLESSFKTPCNKILKPLNESTINTNDSNINNNRERVSKK